MEIGTTDLVTTGVIIAVTQLHNLFKSHAKAQQELRDDQEKYCPPVLTLPDDVPEWKIRIYETQCAGITARLRVKIPARKLLAPIEAAPPSVQK